MKRFLKGFSFGSLSSVRETIGMILVGCVLLALLSQIYSGLEGFLGVLITRPLARLLLPVIIVSLFIITAQRINRKPAAKATHAHGHAPAHGNAHTEAHQPENSHALAAPAPNQQMPHGEDHAPTVQVFTTPPAHAAPAADAPPNFPVV